MYEFKGWQFPDVDKHFVDYVNEYPITSYQQQSIDEAVSYVKEFNCVIDVGANIGLHSVRFSNLFKEVHSFEPASINFECLVQNTSTQDNITLYKKGLGKNKSTEVIKIPKNLNNCGGFSIVDWDSVDDVISETIDIDTLDSLDLKPNLIKIDVQGFDLNVLIGGKNVLLDNKPVILIEAETKKHKSEIFEFLSPLGFELVSQHRKDQIWVHKD